MNLFVYGTLKIPEMLTALLGKMPETKGARLNDYLPCLLIRDNEESEYPALKPEMGAVTCGLLLKNLSEQDLKTLILYEGEEYLLKQVEVNVGRLTEKTACFLLDDPTKYQFGRPWDMAFFRKRYLQVYLNEVIPAVLAELKE